MADTFGVSGFSELARAMETLPVNLQKRALRSSVRAGANLMRDRARMGAPVRSGALKRNIKSEERRDKFNRGRVQFSIGVEHGKKSISASRKKRGEDPYYWYFQEEGYHAVGRAKSKGRKGRAARKQRSRFIRGRHFMRKAFDTTYTSAINLVRTALAREIGRINNQ